MTNAELLATLEASVDCGEASGRYLWAITFLSAALVLLPLAYGALIVFVTWITVRGVTRALAVSASATLPAMIAVLGGIVLLFLIKPLFFFRRQRPVEVQVLEASGEPLLFEFVHKLCAALGAPTPKQIEVDCEANASASFRSGITSMLGDDLVLRIGLPLAAGLTVRQFAGVLAHELGHFSQRGGMRGTYVVRRTNAWFARIVFHRDHLDRRLENLRHVRSARIKIGYYLIVWMVESARGLMWLLMIVGELLSKGVMRRMEFDADRYEAHIAGADDFRGTARVLTLLHVATIGARRDLERSWNTQRLADDFPRLIVANARALPPALRTAVFKAIDEQKTRWFDSHPCASERFEHIRSIQATPMVRCDLPAKRLFANFPALCRLTSEAEYRGVLKEKFSVAALVPTAKLVAEREGERQALEALQRFYQGQVIASRPILPDASGWRSVDDPAASIESLKQSRDNMLAAAVELGGKPAEFERRAVALAIARGKIALASAVGMNRKVGAFRRGAEGEAQKLQAGQNAAVQSMMDFEDSAQARLTIALRLVQAPDITRQLIANGCPQPIQRAEKLARILDALSPSIASVQTARTFAIILRVLIAAYNPRQPHRGITERMAATARELNLVLRKIREELSGVAYPFAHAIKGVSIGASLIEQVPAADAILPTLSSAETLVERFHTVLYRTLAGATQLSERVETVLGMPPLVDPKPSETVGAQDDSSAERKKSRSFWIGYSARAASGLAMLFGLIWLAGGGTFEPQSAAVRNQPQASARNPGPPPIWYQAPAWPPPAAQSPLTAPPSAPNLSAAQAMDRSLALLQQQMQGSGHTFPTQPGAPVVLSPPVHAVPGSQVAPPPTPTAPALTPAPPDVLQETSFVASQKKMHAIWHAIIIWRTKHTAQYPDSLQQLVGAGILPDSTFLESPGDPPAQFRYIKPRSDSPRNSVLIYDPSTYANRPGPAILLHGSTLSLSTAEAMKARIAQDSGQGQ